MKSNNTDTDANFTASEEQLSNSRYENELRAEREYIAFLHKRLDAERVTAVNALDAALLNSSDRSAEALWQREVAVDALSARVRSLRVADNGLCFGRLDSGADGRVDGQSYIGRIGLFDDDNEYEPLLIDWRAPAARAFYCATAANPEGVSRRRHFHTRGRDITDFHDEFLDLDAADVQQTGTNGYNDSVLLASLNAPRGDTMRDIVATIQADQDEIIRLSHTGVVVIEGGPGTGKTAVALHRVAYLLYTQRERLSRRGVLIVGPNPDFFRYIGRVLPSLGETDVAWATPGELLPGLRATTEDHPERKRVKGSAVMVEVLAAAVADRQEVPDTPIAIELEDVAVSLDHKVATSARDRARATGLLHNDARSVFRESAISALTGQAVDQIGAGWLTPEDAQVRAEIAEDVRRELAASRHLRAALDSLWPWLTPQRLLADLFSSWARLDALGAVLDEQDRAALFRTDGSAWTVSDAPLLDEAVEFLGRDRSAERREELRQRERIEYARGVLEILDTDEDPDNELLRAVDLLDPEELSDRHAERDQRPVAERAADDRDWTYGHVVLDEAQELSEMDWRVIMRRCPSRSITVVGDLAQRQSPAGAPSWAKMLDRYVPDRWTYRELTVNYRTPAEIMDIAARVLAEVDPSLQPPVSVRRNGVRPWTRQVDSDDLDDVLADAVRQETGQVGEGSVAVVIPEGMATAVSATVLTPRAAKGLEFDAVIIVEPQRILAAEPHGAAELYVVLTRATQRLGLLHTVPLPSVLQ